MVRSARVCSLLILFFTVNWVSSPTPLRGAPQASGDIPAPTIRVSTRLVLADVVVRDKQGNPVTDLKADDFGIEESGKKQKIATFAAPAQVSSTDPATLAPGLYTNRPDLRAPAGPLTVVLIDAANASFRDQAYGRFQMLKYVAEQSKSKQRIAIYALTNGLHMLQDFTSDPATLQAALQRYQPQEPLMSGSAAPALGNAVSGVDMGPGMSAAIASAANEIASFQSAQVGYVLDMRVRNTLEAMRALGRALGGIPGRKEVIWLTAGFPFDLRPQDRNVSQAEMEMVTLGDQQMSLGTRAAGSTAEQFRESHAKEILQAAAELSTAQVAIYPVDVRGLVSGLESSAGASGAHDPTVVNDTAVATMSDLASTQETMRAMAAETGGKAYVNQNEIKEGVRLALADNSASYTIGYYPDNKKWDGRYRNIKVRVNKPGLELQNRKGYFAFDPTQVKDRKGDQEVADVLRSNIPATLVTFSARAKTGEKGKLGIDFLIDAHTLSSEDASGGSKKFNFAYYAAIFSNDGKMLTSRSMKVDQAFNADTYQKILQSGIMLHLDMDVAAAANEQLRLVVRDERTGYMGSVLGPLVSQ